MPDISKINALAIGSVAKVDGLAKASILDIDGVTVPADGAPAAAYSVRLLGSGVGITSYTGSCMRVREDSGDTETDIGFDGSGNLDTSAIATHCGSANGYVVTWYDQSGNSNNATQSTAGNQPQIYNGTAVITQNGKPTIQFTRVNSLNTSYLNSVVNAICVVKTDATEFNYIICHNIVDNSLRVHSTGWRPPGSTNASDFYYQGDLHIDGSQVTTTQSPTTQRLVFATAVTGGYNFNQSVIGAGFSGRELDGDLQELILYTSSQTSNRTGIESDINTYFGIY